MKRLFIYCFIFSCSSVFAQLNTKEKGITLNFGFGFTSPNITNNVYLGNRNPSFATLLNLNLSYKTGSLSYGINFESIKYATNDGDTTVRFVSAQGGIIQFSTRYNFIESKKSGVYIATGIGVGGLNYERNEVNGNSGKLRMEGFSANFGMGVNFHFNSKIGIFVQVGYAYATFNLKSFEVNNIEHEEFENRPTEDVIFNFRGPDAKLGIRFAF